jgi:hypothetical protein
MFSLRLRCKPFTRELCRIAKRSKKSFNTLVEYLGLSDEIIVPVEETVEIVPTEMVPSGEKFNLHSPGITLQEDGKVAVHHGGYGGHQYVHENIYQQGILRFKLKLESFQNNHWMFVGIAKGLSQCQQTSDHVLSSIAMQSCLSRPLIPAWSLCTFVKTY